MRFDSLLLTASVCLGAALMPREACTNPAKRVEWRQLSDQDKKSYLDSVVCLKTKPSVVAGGPPFSTAYDDFAWAHDRLNTEIHFVASFLPWHRWFVHLYEQQVRLCGYTGPFPYWDWTLDTESVPDSPIWDSELGFGGNGNLLDESGSQTRKCVSDGPFKDIRPVFFGSRKEEHCLARNWNNGGDTPGAMYSFAYTKEVIASIHQLPDFRKFASDLESRPHGAVHSAIGGDMMPSTSPNDPIFFMHHAQVDRLWALWQQENPEVRERDYAGFKTQDKYDGSVRPEALLSDIMNFSGLSKDLTVEDVMSTKSDILCYEY